MGQIAQDLDELQKRLVQTHTLGGPWRNICQFHTALIVFLYAGAIRAQQRELDELEKEINRMKEENIW